VNLYKVDNDWTKIMDSVAFVIVPVANPDGYEYTWTKDRFWRKNRRVNADQSVGVDLNRNFPAHWDLKDGASTDTNSEVYKGPKAASEPETRALMAHFELYKAQVAFAVDVHSFSQLILRPEAHTLEPPSDEKKLKAVSQGITDAIAGVDKRQYTQMRAIELYPTSGDQMSWWRAQKPGIMAFSFELSPDTDDINGFILPPDNIQPVGADILAAIKWTAMEVANKKITPTSSGALHAPAMLLVAILSVFCII
jgi:murein tripeptide amidase MpaA